MHSKVYTNFLPPFISGMIIHSINSNYHVYSFILQTVCKASCWGARKNTIRREKFFLSLGSFQSVRDKSNRSYHIDENTTELLFQIIGNLDEG